MNTPSEMPNVYLDIIVRYPQVWVVEVIALGIFVWFGIRYRLYYWPTLKQFVLTGRVYQHQKNPAPDIVKRRIGRVVLPPSHQPD